MSPARIVMWGGAVDVLIGLVLVVLGLNGGGDVYAIIGGVLALLGAGIFVWFRNRAENNRGDLN